MKQAPDAPILPPRDSILTNRDASPPPLPPRRELGTSPGAHPPSHHLSSLPIGFSQLYIRRHTSAHPRPVRDRHKHDESPR